jgi:hypothetical protein
LFGAPELAVDVLTYKANWFHWEKIPLPVDITLRASGDATSTRQICHAYQTSSLTAMPTSSY